MSIISFFNTFILQGVHKVPGRLNILESDFLKFSSNSWWAVPLRKYRDTEYMCLNRFLCLGLVTLYHVS